MGDLSTLEVIIIAIVEGLTEFLPVSSTAVSYTHLTLPTSDLV